VSAVLAENVDTCALCEAKFPGTLCGACGVSSYKSYVLRWWICDHCAQRVMRAEPAARDELLDAIDLRVRPAAGRA
jgi:hypothetical protein